MKVKFCGMKCEHDIELMNEFLPDYVGFVFAGTKHRITPEIASFLAGKLTGDIAKVGVFVNETPEHIANTAKLVGLDVIQLHGDETPQDIAKLGKLLPDVEIWKGVRVKNAQSIQHALGLGADLLLLDNFSEKEFGGTGKTANFELIRKANLTVPFFLAGGLCSENLENAIRELSPFGVDISSGIETCGTKDRKKIERVMQILGRPDKGGN
jgi:phosphoribosylanthranilate isomerase